MPKKRVIVVGGGAAGLIAAGEAAGHGVETLLFEKQNRLGHKLSITGKGRCNMTNTAPLEEFIMHFGKKGRFLRQAFNRFFSSELIALVGEMGVGTKTERGGRVFPENNDAVALSEALVKWARQRSVSFHMNTPVKKLLIENDSIVGVRTGLKDYSATAVIIATGGLSYPGTGSTGDGYRIAEAAGHTIVATRPALIPLVTTDDTASRLQGLSLRNVAVTVFVENKKKAQAFGEMLFTHYGLSGPIILTLSRDIVDALAKTSHVSISIDLKPALDEKKLDLRLLRDIQEHGKKQVDTLLKGLLPAKLIPVCCDLNSIEPKQKCNSLTQEDRGRLRTWLKDFRLEIAGHRPIEEAIVTAGGVDLKEVDPRTMASKKVRGLFFAGELLDLDGETGGFNLQAAFSTGWLAGNSAAGCE